MQNLPYVLVLVIIISGCTPNAEPERPFTFPPEWEAQEAIWISINDDWGDPVTSNEQISTRLELLKLLHPFVHVKLLTTSDSLADFMRNRLVKMDVDLSRITTIVHPQTTYFLRDPGPLFLSNGKELVMANWQGIDTNSEARREDIRIRKSVDDSLARRFGYEIRNSPISYDGGAIDVCSHTAMSIKDYALNHHSDSFSLDSIENEILSLYGKEQMIWLEGIALIDKSGLKVDNYWGYAPNGHVDAVVRFANDSTILVSTISEDDKDENPIARHDYDVFNGYIDQLKDQQRPNGKPFNIIEIPSPNISHHVIPVPVAYWSEDVLKEEGMDTLFTKSDTILVVPALSYTNFLITNSAVIVAQYWEEGLPESEREKDEQVLSILSSVFPDREIIGFHAKAINTYGGGIHCATQQEPKIELTH